MNRYSLPIQCIVDNGKMAAECERFVRNWIKEQMLVAESFLNHDLDLYRPSPGMPFKYSIIDVFGADTKEDIIEFFKLIYVDNTAGVRTCHFLDNTMPESYCATVSLDHPYIHTAGHGYYLVKKVNVDKSVPLWRYTAPDRLLSNSNWCSYMSKMWHLEQWCGQCIHKGDADICIRCKHLRPGTEDMFKHGK